MKRVKANDGRAISVQARAASDPFTTTGRRSAAAPKSWFDVRLKAIEDSTVDLEEEAWNRMKAWVEDQKLIAFGGYLLMYESIFATREVAQERRRRFYEQEHRQAKIDRFYALREQIRDQAEEGPKMINERLDQPIKKHMAAGNRQAVTRSEMIRQAVGQVGLLLAAMAQEELAGLDECECDGDECLCLSGSESETGSESESENAGESVYMPDERPRKRRRVDDRLDGEHGSGVDMAALEKAKQRLIRVAGL
ncbi:hypothetical protein PG991_001002 [Apiospora marii]|uniref:Uncharacterized protein n=1 Tax=Apiospora marii TaxID=335849 RepID=A0ABR1SUX8_9PEZI